LLTYSTTHSTYIRPLLLAKHKVFFLLILAFYVLTCPPLVADAIPPEESAAYQPRDWTLPGELTPEEQAQLALDVINQAILAGAAHTSDSAKDKPNPTVISDIVSPSINQPIATLLPVTPSDQVVKSTTPEVTTVKALEKAGPAPTTVAYQAKYKELQAQWKSKINGKSMAAGYSVFFQLDDLPSESDTPQKSSDDPYGINAPASTSEAHESVEALSSGNITSNAIQALMLRYLSDNPEIDIPVDGINAASAFVSAAPENAVRINDALLKSVILDPALDAFTKKNKSMYASIIRLEGSGNGQYVIVVIDKHGNVSLIDPALNEKVYDTKLLSGIVTSLNTQRQASDLKFVAAETDSIVYTGLNGKDLDNTRSGLYAFAYWAAFMSTDKLDAYQSVNGAATEETNALDSYDSINLSAVYSKKVKKTPAIKDATAFELDLREWLRTQVKFN
jgi:hypothetical protein